MIKDHYIEFEGSKLHYVKAGEGKEILLFFHGFGQDHTIYIPLIQSLAGTYSLFIFDIFYHGRSTWAHGERPLDKVTWRKIFNIFLSKNGIDKFSLVGYSLGGKFALATLDSFPDKVSKIFLIAPDGIRENVWHRIATSSFIMRRFLKGMIGNYNWFETLANTVVKWKIADPGLARFADYQMGTEAKRKRVYFTWVVFRRLKFSIRSLAKIINDYKIETTLIVGKYDTVILPEHMKGFLKLLKNYKFEILESGHSGMIYQSLPFIKKGK
jgi:pimeloyl-ACP methyl ester carboxylesterase